MAKCKCPPPGLPGYMGTFADLMSLLMCFFVLLLSFAEMDAEVQADRRLHGEGVRGTEHSRGEGHPQGNLRHRPGVQAGSPGADPIDTIMQQTMDMTQTELDFQPGDADQAGGHDKSEEKLVGATPSRRRRNNSSRSSPTRWPRRWRIR